MTGSELRAAARRAGLSLAEIADKLGVSRQAVGGWARGERPIPASRLPDLRRILVGAAVPQNLPSGPRPAAPSPRDLRRHLGAPVRDPATVPAKPPRPPSMAVQRKMVAEAKEEAARYVDTFARIAEDQRRRGLSPLFNPGSGPAATYRLGDGVMDIIVPGRMPAPYQPPVPYQPSAQHPVHNPQRYVSAATRRLPLPPQPPAEFIAQAPYGRCPMPIGRHGLCEMTQVCGAVICNPDDRCCPQHGGRPFGADRRDWARWGLPTG